MSWTDKTSGDKPEYDNTNKGRLFNNSYKSKSSQPDVRGEINIEGKEYKLSGWVNESRKSGDKYFALQVEPKEAEKQETATDAIGEVTGGDAESIATTDDLPPSSDEGEDVPF